MLCENGPLSLQPRGGLRIAAGSQCSTAEHAEFAEETRSPIADNRESRFNSRIGSLCDLGALGGEELCRSGLRCGQQGSAGSEPQDKPVRTVVVALGNPDRADDGVGPAVIQAIEALPEVEVWEAIRGGLPLAQALVGFDRALVVDACPALAVGEVALIPLFTADGPRTTDHGSWLHGMGLSQALEALGTAGFSVPETWALAIGVEGALPFRRGLSPEVARAVPAAVAEVNRWLAN